MNPLNLITDSYERPARLYPALLLIAPAVLGAIAVLSQSLSTLQSIGALAIGCGLSFLLTQLARDGGKQTEKALFKEWGGLPSVAILRHRDARVDPITKARYHKTLAKLVKNTDVPSVLDEETDTISADVVYTAWSNYLRNNTRDTKKYALLFKENINYGYRRNVFGLRTLGLVVSIASCIVLCAWISLLYHNKTGIDANVYGALAFAVVLSVLWCFRFSSSWVRVPADAYAERLVETTDSAGLGKSTP